MELAELIAPTAVKAAGKVTSKKRLFQILGEVAHSAYGLHAEDTVEALIERENLGPTGVGQGVAMPHARMGCVDKVVGAFIKLDSPLDFGAADRKGVDLVFALFAPTGAGAEHHRALALASRTMRDASLCDRLRSNDDISTLHALLANSQSQAA